MGKFTSFFTRFRRSAVFIAAILLSTVSSAQFTNLWIQVSNPSAGPDVVNAITSDASGIYVVGYDNSPGDNQWHIEKRDLTTGSLIPTFGTGGVVTNNPSVGDDVAYAITVDASGIYVAGTDGIPGNNQWRIEKRDLITGSLIPTFGTGGVVTNNPSVGKEYAWAITVDASGIYVAGHDYSPGNVRWRMEKRNLTTGALINTFGIAGVVTNNPSTGNDFIRAITVDASGIYVAGNDYVPGDFEWRIEKHNLNTGALIWAQTSNSGPNIDFAYAITADASGIYVVGNNNTGSSQWQMEKRSLTTGVLIGTFGTGGIITSNPSAGPDCAYAITANASGIYVAGNDYYSPSDGQWLIEKRDLTTGGILCTQTSNPSTSGEYAYAITADASGIYVAGYDDSLGGADYQWRIEKYDFCIPSSIDAAFLNDTVCLGDSTTFTDLSTGSPTSWSWNFGDPASGADNTSSIQNPKHLFTSAGTYLVKLVVSDGSNADSITKSVVVNPIYNISCSDSICQGDSMLLQGSYQRVTGMYYDTLTTIRGCDSIITTTLTVNALPKKPDVADIKLCTYTRDATFIVNNSNPLYHYYWYDSIGGTALTGCNNANCSSIDVDDIIVPDEFYVRCEDANGCISPYDTVYVTEVLMPVADFSIETIPPYYERQQLQFRDESTNGYRWEWQFGDGQYSTDRHPKHNYTQEGLYWVQLIVSTLGPPVCRDTITDTLQIVKKTQIYVPSTFTPNGDNLNDMLKVLGEGIETITFKIYNQWGILLFESENQTMGWDGLFNGNPQPEGNYVYILQAATFDKQEIFQQGVVSLVR